MANNASATVDLKILISVIQNQSQVIKGIQNQFQTMLQQFQTAGPVMAGLTTGVTGLNAQVAGLNTHAAAIQANAAKGVAGIKALDGAVQSLTNGLKFLAGGFLALEGVRFLKGLADAAARTEVLATVLHVVANNSGYTGQQVDLVWAKIQRLGITADAAAQSLTQMMQANISIEFAPALARAAQDLAVIEGSDSSATFERLITAIQTLNTLTLRRMGIVVSLTQAEARWRVAHKDHVGELDAQQRAEALLNEVLEKARGLQGTYEAAMGNVGKQMTSLTRLFADLRSELGKQLLPAYSAIVSELSLFLTQMGHVLRIGNENMDWAERFGEVMRTLARRFFEVVMFLVEHRKAIEALAAAYATYWAILAGQAVLTHTIAVVTTLTNVVWGAVTAIRSATTATLAWAAANGLLNSSRTAGAVGAGVQMGLDFGSGPIGKAAGQQGALSGMIRMITEAGPRILGWLRAMEAGIVAVVQGAVSLVASLNPVTLALGAIVLVGTAWLTFAYKFTSAAGPMNETWRLIKELFVELGKAITEVVNVGFTAFAVVLGGVGVKAKDLTTQLQALGFILEHLPGNPIQQTKNAFTLLNIGMIVLLANTKAYTEAMKTMHEQRAVVNTVAVDQLVALKGDLLAAERALQDTKDNLTREVRDKGFEIGSQAAKPYEEAFNAAKALVDKYLAEEQRIRKTLNKQDSDIADARAARNKARAEETRILNAYDAAAAKTGTTVIDGKTVTKEFAEANSQIRDLIEGYIRLKQISDDMAAGKGLAAGEKVTGERLKETTDQVTAAQLQMFKAIEAAGPKVTDSTARDLLNAQIARVEGFANASQQRMLRGLATSVGIQISKYISPAVQASEAYRAAAFKDAEAKTAASLDHRLEMTRIANEKEADADRIRLEQDGSFQDEFNLRTLGRQQAVAELELAIGQNRIDALERQRVAAIDRGPEAQSALAVARSKAEQEQEELKAKKNAEMAGVGAEQRAAALKLSQDITLEVAKQIAVYGDLDEALRAVNLKYDQERRDRKGQDASDIQLKREAEIQATILRYVDQRLALARETIRLRGVAVEAEKQTLALAKERVELELAAGRITPAQSMRLQNALLLREIETEMTTLAKDRAELESKREERRIKTALIVADMEARFGKKEDSPETRARILAETGQVTKDIEALMLSTEAGAIRIDRMAERLVSYGKQFRDVFQSSLTQMLTDIAMFNGKLVDTIANFGKALGNQFFKSVFENVSSKITKMVSEIGTHVTKDPVTGKETRSPGIFENLFKWMGLGVKADGSAENPYTVIVKNIAALTGGQMSSVQGFKQAAFTLGTTAFSGMGGQVAGVAQLAASIFSQIMERRKINNLVRALDFTMAEGGPVNGPGTGTSDSIPAMLSAGEHVMPAAKAAMWMPVLEAIRTGRLSMMATGGWVQPSAFGSIIPRRYVGGGVVTTDGGAAAVQTGMMGGNMMVQLHPEALNMTMRDWLEHEVVRQHSRR